MFNWHRKPKDNGLFLGRLFEEGKVGNEVHYREPIHAITIGPNGSGKGTRLIVPNLAELPRSIFIIDPKGEALAITGRARAKLGRVHIINPFNLLADSLPHLKSHGYNPMADLDARSDEFVDDATLMGLSMVPERGSGGSGDSHFFNSSGQALATALVMWEKIRNGKDGNLANVRKALTEPFIESGLQKTIIEMAESHCGPLRSKAGRFVTGSRSVLDIVSTTINETNFLDSPPIQRDLGGPGFDWNLMKREIVTVYLVLPADRLESHANYLRLIVTSALRTLLRSPPSETLPPVLFILDEFAALGYLPPIENAAGIARGFGVQLWPILQDLNQLKALYRDRWQTFIGNAGLLTAFAPRDWFTAKYLSDLCGQKLRNVRSRSMSDDGRVNWNDAPHEFPRFRPEDLMRMPQGQMLCLAAGVPLPFFTQVPGYWNTPQGRDLDPNPYFKPKNQRRAS
jgi:type IV secretion system protein VirD4